MSIKRQKNYHRKVTLSNTSRREINRMNKEENTKMYDTRTTRVQHDKESY
jgi:hypothetical protein